MNFGNVYGSLLLARHHPHLIRPFSVHILHRLTHVAGKYLNNQVHPPEQITVVVTDKCNLRCKMCQYAHSSSPGYSLSQDGDMAPELFRKLMDEVPEGVSRISRTAGRTRHYPHLFALLLHDTPLTPFFGVS